ncbi:MAG: Tll0287-like domain-containing protein, partial [Ferruginibacter sp.]
VEALPITAVYASAGITVSRVSDKNRNAKNALTEMDKIEWAKYIKQIANKDSLRAAIVYNNNEVHYYKPIIMQPMCLSCHGTTEKDIAKELLPVIDSLYPADKAKGYKAGELRGMWHIVFTKPMVDEK